LAELIRTATHTAAFEFAQEYICKLSEDALAEFYWTFIRRSIG